MKIVNVPVIEFVAALLLFATSIIAQLLATQVKILNWPFVPHVAVPPPEYPVSHVTSTVCPVVPVILPASALSELATLPAGVHEFATQVNASNRLFVPQVTVPLPEYPVLQVIVVV